MPEPARGTLTVGGKQVEMSRAREWVAAYLNADANRSISHPFAYPAYDRYRTGSSADELNDGDLLSPGLLNVAVKIRPFYALQAIRDDLQSGLAAVPTDLSLTDADEGQVLRFL